jgi:hypothetical protein
MNIDHKTQVLTYLLQRKFFHYIYRLQRIKNYIRRKNGIHKKAKKTNTIGLWENIRKIRNKCNTLILNRCKTLLRYLYILRFTFYFPYLSLLAQPFTIFVYGPVVYGPARYLHYFR